MFFLVLICKCFGLGAFWPFQTSHRFVSTKRFNNYLNKCLQKLKLPWSPLIISFLADNLTVAQWKCPAVNCQDEQVFGNCGALLLHPRELLKKLLLAGRPTAREIQKKSLRHKKKCKQAGSHPEEDMNGTFISALCIQNELSCHHNVYYVYQLNFNLITNCRLHWRLPIH